MLAVHDEQLAEHGGLPGVRAPDIADMAASYAFGMARNHPFADGNKRTALVVAELFLELNGHELTARDPACVATILALAASELTERELATWIRDNSRGPSRVEP